MFQIPEKKREYWNHKSATFLDEIKVEMIHSKDQTRPVDDDTIVLRPASIESLYEYSTDCDDHIVGISYINEEVKYHVNNDLCKEVEKCVNDFYKIKIIKNKISKDSLRNIVLSWLFETKIKEHSSIEITQYIEEELYKRIKEYVRSFGRAVFF